MEMMDYRWDELDNARGYDQAAEHVHPYYREVQDVILEHLPLDDGSADWVVDLGGGSGRLAERILDRWRNVRICVVDQSKAFLTLAGQRLERFGSRAICLCVAGSRIIPQVRWAEASPGRAISNLVRYAVARIYSRRIRVFREIHTKKSHWMKKSFEIVRILDGAGTRPFLHPSG